MTSPRPAHRGEVTATLLRMVMVGHLALYEAVHEVATARSLLTQALALRRAEGDSALVASAAQGLDYCAAPSYRGPVVRGADRVARTLGGEPLGVAGGGYGRAGP